MSDVVTDDTELVGDEPPNEALDLDLDPDYAYDEAAAAPRPDEPGRARDQEARLDRLSRGADDLRNRAGSFIERTGILLIVSAVLVTLGLSLILVAWRGTSRSIHVEEQISYVVSGGILGATLAIVGAFCLFSHWLTAGLREARVREERAQRRHEELLEALGAGRIDPLALDVEGGNNGHARR